ncbi:hypothetical protein M911_08900 [Ectothiorhodospira haloalkaliphila]|uniref:Uncharacterized protein n=1 Tax=Ectothiorhodospira haloalkaliphila TaxID=421628 RepID=W8KNI0_9GAMM|nr:hypothetical protein [Ectothiorhodospira haloalkaliphila]AHK80693.1 hypothetical protein M911_08900 [Ectothiorhodospira haloalkaliphila]
MGQALFLGLRHGLIGLQQRLPEQARPEMSGEFIAVVQFPKVVGVAQHVLTAGVAPVGSPVIRYSHPFKVGQNTGLVHGFMTSPGVNHHLVRVFHHLPGHALVALMTTTGSLTLLARLGRALTQTLRGRGVAGVAAALLDLLFQRGQSGTERLQCIEQLHDQRILLRVAHGVAFCLTGALELHTEQDSLSERKWADCGQVG